MTHPAQLPSPTSPQEPSSPELLPPSPSSPAPRAAPPIDELLQAWLSGRSPATLRAYRQDLESFRRFLEEARGEALEAHVAASLLLEGGPGAANHLALRWRSAMVEQELAPATINRRLAALRSLVQLARQLGAITWAMDIKSVRHRAYRDTRGPGRRRVIEMFEAIEGDTPKAARDRAILCLLFDLALRRGELVALDLKHLDLDGGSLTIVEKGSREPRRLSLPPSTVEVLGRWVRLRPVVEGQQALFLHFDRADKGDGRLSDSGVYRLVRKLGEAVGVKVRPHGLRHASITAALDETQGDVRSVQRFSRHAKLDTLTLYDDARKDLAGEVAGKIALGVLGRA
jgi:integrase/recombinase XerC